MFRILELLTGGVIAAMLGTSWVDPLALAASHQDETQQAPPPPGDRSGAADQRDPPRQRLADQAPGPRDWRRDGNSFRLSPESRDHVIAVIADLRPLSDEERTRLVGMSLDELRSTLAEQGGMILGLARLRETQPELYDLRIADMRLLRRIQELIEKVRQAGQAEEADALVAAERDLRAAIAEQIDLRFEIREREITALEERVAAMRAELAREREQPREALITRRLDLLESYDGREPWRDNNGRAGDGESPPQPQQAGAGDGP